MSTEHPVTVSVARTILPGYTRQANAWAHAGQELAREWPGYLGSGWVRTSADSDEWNMLYRFADAESLQDWEQSEERRWWIDSAREMMETTRVERRTGIEGWFAQPGDVTVVVPETVVPPRWKQAVSIFLPFFPLSLLANFLLHPVTQGWPLVFQILVTVCILTPLMTYIFLPITTRLLQPWLQAKPRGKRHGTS
ncbi:antibiotic biosynthesis monooxygenase [Paenarthrobacter sp. NPDC092416]|uniref:antibiotic biosynthesis monooxygenase n=1 Tax=Paenarthrobacter sp. NPDC092416 TaxID=3364386 RepID=UPI0038280806